MPASGFAGLRCPGVPDKEGPSPYEVLAALAVSLRRELAEAQAELGRARERGVELEARLAQSPWKRSLRRAPSTEAML